MQDAINLQQVLILAGQRRPLIVKGAEVEVKTSYGWNHVKGDVTEAEHLPWPMMSRVVRESHEVTLMIGCPVGSREITSSFHFWVSCGEPPLQYVYVQVNGMSNLQRHIQEHGKEGLELRSKECWSHGLPLALMFRA
jgi:hypothetical protein